MWNVQFFSFAVLEFGQFLGISLATELKLNKHEEWLKVRCKLGVILPSELEVRLPNSSFLVSPRIFSPECVPFRLVFGFLASTNVSSAGSCGGFPSSSLLESLNRFKEVGVQVDDHLIHLHAASGLECSVLRIECVVVRSSDVFPYSQCVFIAKRDDGAFYYPQVQYFNQQQSEENTFNTLE